MKIFIKSITMTMVLLMVICVSAQTPKTSVFAVDFIKTLNGQQENYLKFIEQNWAKARAFMKDKGIVASYRVLSLPSDKAKDWDVLLITEYVNQPGFEKREEVFQEFRKTQPQILVNGMTSRQMAEIKFSRELNQPISSEVGEVMLKTQNANPEAAAARVPLENYLQGHATGNPEFMKKAFHTEGKLIFMSNGKYTTRTFAEYIAGMKGTPQPDEAQRKRWIESIDIAGNSAIGKIILDYPSGKFTDYMTLLKIDGEWKIVNKSFYVEPKTPAQK